jgi:outer membrane protein TolC
MSWSSRPFALRGLAPVLALLLLAVPRLHGQGSEVLSFKAYLSQVQAQHPLAKQIRLLRERGRQEVQRARGAFDPNIGVQFDAKSFDNKNYYSIFQSYVKVPTWIGIEAEGGFVYNSGIYLNPEDKVPENGQAYLGLNLPLLQGLITNERQLMVRQAQAVQTRNEAELALLINDLLYEAAKAYWDWMKSYYEIQLIEQSLVLAQQRYNATKGAFEQGDKPAIDTLESFLIIQDRQMRLREAQLNFQQHQWGLSMYLWSAQQQPLSLAPNAMPMPLSEQVIAPLDSNVLLQALERSDSLHPALAWYEWELKRLEWERKLKANKILPKLDLKYNLLAVSGLAFMDDPDNTAHNYKLGVKFSMPLLLRQSRADLELTKLKLQETRFKREQKRWELNNKVQSYFAEVQLFAAQTKLLEQMVENYSTLLQAEQQKFSIGESSIFLLNAREMKLLDSREKLLSTKIKYFKAKTGLNWVLAQLGME